VKSLGAHLGGEFATCGTLGDKRLHMSWCWLRIARFDHDDPYWCTTLQGVAHWSNLICELIWKHQKVRTFGHRAARQASLQYFTSLQTRAQRRRHENGRPHVTQIFSARKLGGT
jgi:hypothetical protein